MVGQQISLDKNLLIQLLHEAYQAGWYGSLEMQHSAVDQIFARNFPTNPSPPLIIPTDWPT